MKRLASLIALALAVCSPLAVSADTAGYPNPVASGFPAHKTTTTHHKRHHKHHKPGTAMPKSSAMPAATPNP